MNHTAPEGYVYVCRKCGKRSHDKYGENPIDKGWDASCMLNSILLETNKLEITNNRVTGVRTQ